MNLRETLKEHEGQWCYVGASSSFFWIGISNEDALVELERLSERAYKKLGSQIEKTTAELQSLNETLPQRLADFEAIQKAINGTSLEGDFKHQLDTTTKKLESAQYKQKNKTEWLQKKIPYFETFVPFLDREVTEVYDREVVKPLGKIISIVGEEIGEYWDLDEFNKAKERGRNNG